MERLSIISVACLLPAAMVASCSSNGGDAASGRGTVAGNVCDRRTEQVAISDAYVYVTPSAGGRAEGVALRQAKVAEGHTDSTGAFSLSGLPPGSYTVFVEPPDGSEFNGAQFNIAVTEDGTVRQSLRLGSGSDGTCFPDPSVGPLFGT